MSFLERGSQLAELHEAFRESTGTTGHAVFLGGEAGVGKSTLVRQFSRDLTGNTRILFGACDPLGTPRPLGPLHDMLDGLGDDVERAVLDGAPRASLFRSVLRAIAGARAPTLMIIEDAHWADEATLDLLRYLIRRLETTLAMLLVTYRDDEVGTSHPLRVLLGDIAGSPHVRRITLPPLTRDAVRTLASGRDIDAEGLFHRTGGNAFFVTEILASGTDQMPDTIRDAVLSRAARLGLEARVLLDVAAVLGPRSEVSLLLQTTESVINDVSRALEECLTTGVLVFENGTVGFRHELAREAVLQGMSPLRRQSLHSQALDILQSVRDIAEPARLAHHAESAGDRDATLRYSLEAAQAAATLSAHREALIHYRRALSVADVLPDEQRADILDAAAFEAYITGEMEFALQAFRSAITLRHQLGDRLGEGRSLRRLYRTLGTSLRGEDADATLDQAIRVLEMLGPTDELAMAYSSRSQMHMLAGRNRECILWGERAIALAEGLGAIEPLVHSLNNVGQARFRLGDARGRADVERSLELALRHGLEDDVARAYINLSSAHLDFLHLDVARDFVSRGISYCVDHDLEQYRLFLEAQSAMVSFLRGALGDAETAAHAVLKSRFSPPGGMQAHIVLARVHARRGDPDAQELLDQALDEVRRSHHTPRIAQIDLARIEFAWLAGKEDEAAQIAGRGFQMAIQQQHVAILGQYAVWLSRISGPGNLNADLPAMPPPFSLYLGGDIDAAAAEWEHRGCSYEAALCQVEQNDPGEIRRAYAVFERLGARPAVAMATRKLQALGVRDLPRGPRPATRATPGHLTEREVEVLRLVAQGMRNSEIAEHLYVSPHTVGHHVSAILAKLDVRSRSEAVSVGARLGLVRPGDHGESATAT